MSISASLSHVMLCKAKQHLEKQGVLSRIRFIHGDTKSIGTTHIFDAVLSILVAHFIPLESKQNFFKDIFTQLKPNGMLLTYDLMKETEAHEIFVLKQLCENNGLTTLQSEKMVERLQQDFFLVSPRMGQQLLSKYACLLSFNTTRTTCRWKCNCALSIELACSRRLESA